MNDKNNNSNSEDKSYSDSVELFDKIFAPTKPDEAPDSKKEHPTSALPSDKKDQKKVPPKAKQGIEPPQKALDKKTISPVQQGSNKLSVKQDTTITKTKPPALDSSKTITQKVPKIERKEIKPEKKPSIKESPVKDDKPVKPRIEKTESYKKPKKSLNPLIFTLSIVVLVILSMFAGKVMDYDAIMVFLKIKNLSTSISEPISRDNTNEKEVSVSKDTKAPSPAGDFVESKIEESDIQGPDTIIKEEETQVNAAPLLSGKNTDEISNVIKERILSYPYSIYLGSYGSITKVKKASSEYAKMGISPYWVELDLGEKGIWFRLFAGYFQTKEETVEFIKTRQIQGAEPKLTKYANLIGVYTSEEYASRNKAKLEDQGYSPYIISDKEDIFQLYLGAFYQKARAEKQNSDLALKGIQSELVER